MQHIAVFQRDGLGANKVKAVRDLRPDLEIRVFDVDGPLPPIVDEPKELFPEELPGILGWADLVLDHLYHPDLTAHLLDRCEDAGVPVIASGRKLTRGHTPTTCCTLGRLGELGEYARAFGAPEFEVELEGETLTAVRVLRGAPCGATWQAAQDVVGLPVAEAVPRIGLATQFHCYAKANPNVFLTNPLHVAGEIHIAALEKALKKAARRAREEVGAVQ